MLTANISYRGRHDSL